MDSLLNHTNCNDNAYYRAKWLFLTFNAPAFSME